MLDERDSGGPDLAATQSFRPDAKGADRPGGTLRQYVLVFEGQSCYAFDLPSRGEVVIGRAPECGLRIEAASASRQHAQLDVTSGAVWISDLKSRNGTRVNGDLLTAARPLLNGDMISICSATLIFHREVEAPQRRSLLPISYLRQRLEEEIDRSQHYQRPVSLVSLRLGGTQPSRQELGQKLADHLRTLDILSWSDSGGLLILCPELNGEEVAELATRLSTVLQPLCPQLQTGLSTCPEDGTDADTLLAVCQAAAQSASDGGPPKSPSDMVNVVEFGERRILIAEPSMKRLYSLIEKLGPSDLPVLVHGETGTGKELAAAALHHASKRRNEPLVAVNCAALTESIVESELFGHERGAFSGAVTSKAGLFETAHGGTLFLDEIGELPLSIQPKLLRVLETQKIMRVGDTRERAIDVRLVAATNRDLAAEVEAGRFRRDLYFRLSTARLSIPPLRDRRRELPVLARSLLEEACVKRERPKMELASATLHRLLAYRWPGNIRELKNLMDFVAATVDEQVLMPWHVVEQIGGDKALADGSGAAPKFRTIDEEVRALERRRMVEALAASGGVHVRAAALIGMPIRTFTGKLKLYRISVTKGGDEP
jgi:two-component system response regulator AtoC